MIDREYITITEAQQRLLVLGIEKTRPTIVRWAKEAGISQKLGYMWVINRREFELKFAKMREEIRGKDKISGAGKRKTTR